MKSTKIIRLRSLEFGSNVITKLQELHEKYQPVVDSAQGCYWIAAFFLFVGLLVCGVFILLGYWGPEPSEHTWLGELGLSGWTFFVRCIEWLKYVVIVVLLVPLILLLLAFMTFLAVRLPSALIWICMAPYSLTRWVDKEGALERTFVLIGTVMTAAGIAMCLFTSGP